MTMTEYRKPGFGEKKKLVVMGSLNWDVTLKMKRLPLVGETLDADDDVHKAFGGKGAN